MREDLSHNYWCPSARMAVQRVKQGNGIETVPVAYNRSTMAQDGLDEAVQAGCCCLGRRCACWRHSAWNFLLWLPFFGYFYKRRGYCGLTQRG